MSSFLLAPFTPPQADLQSAAWVRYPRGIDDPAAEGAGLHARIPVKPHSKFKSRATADVVFLLGRGQTQSLSLQTSAPSAEQVFQTLPASAKHTHTHRLSNIGGGWCNHGRCTQASQAGVTSLARKRKLSIHAASSSAIGSRGKERLKSGKEGAGWGDGGAGCW